MKTIFTLIFSILIVLSSFNIAEAQSSYAVVKSNGTTIIAASFQSALDTAAAGDIIYLPASSISIGNTVIDKQVHIIGAGYCPDSSGGAVTQITGNYRITKGADGGSLTGVAILGDFFIGTSGSDQDVDGYSCSRCWFGTYSGSFQLGCNTNRNPANINGKNYNFTECIFDHDWTFIAKAKKVQFDKCIFKSRLHECDGEVTFKNCIFYYCDDSYALFNGMKGAIIENSIMRQPHYFSCTNLTFNNNLFCSPATQGDLAGNFLAGNVFNFDSSKVFLGYDGTKWIDGSFKFSPGNRFHLKPQALAALKGTDGKEVGIYGGNEPFKDGALPLVPAIKQAKVSTKSNAKGKLEIEFKVQAQSK
ncbi:MAG: hypothetical protein HW421_2176 [Ignavibacteria bacterium]|nr:hypothetical protein [Ignavibacteria bacterium]